MSDQPFKPGTRCMITWAPPNEPQLLPMIGMIVTCQERAERALPIIASGGRARVVGPPMMIQAVEPKLGGGWGYPVRWMVKHPPDDASDDYSTEAEPVKASKEQGHEQ